MRYEIAQVNMGRVKAPLDALIMAGFVKRLNEINALTGALEGYGLRNHWLARPPS
jgi:hypothetical protein